MKSLGFVGVESKLVMKEWRVSIRGVKNHRKRSGK